MKFINKVQRFMYGRYGMDDLYKFLFKIYILLLIIGIFVKHSIFFIVELFIIIIMFYRFFSKKIYIRSKENQLYLKCKNKLLKPFRNIKRSFKDKDHIYKKCRYCKAVLKLPLPYSRGIKHSKCPKCKKRVTIFAFKKQKIEIIKNKK